MYDECSTENGRDFILINPLFLTFTKGEEERFPLFQREI